MARWTDIKTQRDLEEGRWDDAQKNIERVLHLSRDLRRRGPLISQFVSIAMDAICYEGPVKRFLSDPDLTTERCDRLLASLAQHKQQAVDPLVEGMRSEYVMMRTTIHDIQFRTGDFDPKGFKERWGTDSDSIGAFITAFGGTGDGSNQQALKIDPRLARMTDEDYANEIAKVNELYKSVVALADRPYREQAQGIKAAESSLRMETDPADLCACGGNPVGPGSLRTQRGPVAWHAVSGDGAPLATGATRQGSTRSGNRRQGRWHEPAFPK